MNAPGWGHQQHPQPGCVRHPDRPTGLSCARCGRPACPDCLRPAPVGFHCVDCVAQDQRGHAQAVTAAGVPQRTAAKTPFAGIPIVTYTLIVLNVLAYVVTAAQSSSILDNHRGSDFFNRLVLVPGMVANGDVIRLIGSGFLHYGLIHLAVNMYALYVVGIACENALGRIRYSAVYLLALLGGSAAVMFGAVNSQTAGASGAVFGLFGAILIILLRLKRNANMIIGVIVLNVIISVTVPGISWLGHAGGLVAGSVAVAGIIYAPQLMQLIGRKRPTVAHIAQLGFGILAAVLVVEVALIALRVVGLREQYGPVLATLHF
ncbi:rhomboid family intramembrane serine protease [Tomitella biformata]|uniref:rhomboid family intramembrane serine protease n=1 Tax=Tomitella biformata TaxID=630403 RepID=UPI00056E016B|nr:rhomboid family intramembrane serine protease [Tomitella biformata]